MNTQEREHKIHTNDVFSTRITIYRNGDLNFYGKKLVVNRKHIRTFNSFLDEVTRDTQAKVAIRSIRTPNHGTVIANLDKIENGGVYVAVGLEKFKHLPYKEIPNHDNLSLRHHLKQQAKPVPHNRIYASARYQKLAVSEPLCNRIILVYRNGDDLYAGKKLLLDKRLLENMDTLLQYITDKIKLTTGAVRSLHSLDGSIIKETSQLETGVKYVAVGYQKHFVKGIYLNEGEPFNVSIKKFHHKALSFKKKKKKNKLIKENQEVQNDHLNETIHCISEVGKTVEGETNMIVKDKKKSNHPKEDLNISSTDEEKNTLKSELVFKNDTKVALNSTINQQDSKVVETKIIGKNTTKVTSNSKSNQEDSKVNKLKLMEKSTVEVALNNNIVQQDPKGVESRIVEINTTKVASNKNINHRDSKVVESKIIEKNTTKVPSNNKINQQDPKLDESKFNEKSVAKSTLNDKINQQNPKIEEAKIIEKVSSKKTLISKTEGEKNLDDSKLKSIAGKEENGKDNILQNQSIEIKKKRSLSETTVKNIYSKSLPTNPKNVNEIDSNKPIKMITSHLSISNLEVPPGPTERDLKSPTIFKASGVTMETANEVVESHETNIEPAVEIVFAKEIQDEEIEKESDVKLAPDE